MSSASIRRYVLDTNVVSELAREHPHRGVLDKITAHQETCVLAVTTLEELYFGVSRLPESRKRTQLERWLEGIIQSFETLPYDARAAQWLGRERARLGAEGKPAPRSDGEIAAIAFTHGLTLVTRNTQDFANYPDMLVENWFEEARS